MQFVIKVFVIKGGAQTYMDLCEKLMHYPEMAKTWKLTWRSAPGPPPNGRYPEAWPWPWLGYT